MHPTETVDNLGIPPLAGICSYERAALPGLGVERTTEILKRCNYVARRLHETATAHLAAMPEWEVKCALGLHLWLDAEHCSGLRARVAEMREPPLHLDDVPDERLRAALEEYRSPSQSVEGPADTRRRVRTRVMAAGPPRACRSHGGRPMSTLETRRPGIKRSDP